MSTKRKTYPADFKAKLVLEVLEGEQTLNEIASKYEILPKNLQNWKKQFMENMSLAVPCRRIWNKTVACGIYDFEDLE
ncbi:MAG: transposase [Campylobacterota bacterium]|nr:transposase [Campylobacterota bacterium]